MPAEERVRREQGADLLQNLTPQDFRLHGQSSALVIVEQNASFSQLLFEHRDLRPLKLDDLLLLLIDPAGQGRQEKLPGMKNERHDRPMR
jgi:hypothetical protein